MKLKSLVLFLVMGVCAGCAHNHSGNDGVIQSYAVPMVEAAWIRNGDPIVFEKHRWYPVDDSESLMDSEVFQIAEYSGVPIFVAKIDARPYDRLYTKFGKSKFRYFERMPND